MVSAEETQENQINTQEQLQSVENPTKRMKMSSDEHAEINPVVVGAVESTKSDTVQRVANISDGQQLLDSEPSSSTISAEETSNTPAKEYRLRINNLKKYSLAKEFKPLLELVGINQKLKKNPEWVHGFLSFPTAEEQEEVYQNLLGVEHKKEILIIEKLEPILCRVLKPRVQDPNDTRTPAERLNDQVSPLWRLSYENQLGEKQGQFYKILRQFAQNLKKMLRIRDITAANKETLQYIPNALQKYNGLLCPLLPMVPSPKQKNYRNKVEFAFGNNHNGKKTIGFMLGLFNSSLTVAEPTETLNVSLVALKIVSIMQTFLENSELDVYNREKRVGFWRILQIRSFDTGDVMIILQVDDSNCAPGQCEKELNAVYALFETDEYLKTLDATIYIQKSKDNFNGISEEQGDVVLAKGKGYAEECLNGMRFRVGPMAFFQVSTSGASVLFNVLRDWCIDGCVIDDNFEDTPINHRVNALENATEPREDKSDEQIGGESTDTTTDEIIRTPKKKTLLLDLCCGTGTIGQILSKHVTHVLGIDIIQESITNAIQNAKLNNIKNVTYLCGKVEDVFHGRLKRISGNYDEVIAVLDPPRAGLGHSVIRTIRACKEIKRVIYVACAAEMAIGNFHDLCRVPNNKFPGPVFRMGRAMGVDLFPGSKGAELVCEFVRM